MGGMGLCLLHLPVAPEICTVTEHGAAVPVLAVDVPTGYRKKKKKEIEE